MIDLVKVEKLTKHYPVSAGIFQRTKKFVHAVDDVNFSIRAGETFGLGGESGCGKTTLGRLIMKLIEPTSGLIEFMGKDISNMSNSELKDLRPKMQLIFQDPFASLNPRRTIRQILSQPFTVNEDLSRNEVETRVVQLLESVRLCPTELFMDRNPHELSGGQKQRVVIARAIALRPKLVVADEPVSALDMSVRAQILNLMRDLGEKFNLTTLLISHDLAVLRSMTNRIAIMYLSKFVEMGSVEQIFMNPLHPYTKALLAATPIPKPRLARKKKRFILKGDAPSPIDPPQGCRFNTRCPFARDECKREPGPTLIDCGGGHLAACPYIDYINSQLGWERPV
jgi:oligopeptide/dipeptide ABC transporter ATP-binding protein